MQCMLIRQKHSAQITPYEPHRAKLAHMQYQVTPELGTVCYQFGTDSPNAVSTVVNPDRKPLQLQGENEFPLSFCYIFCIPTYVEVLI